MSRPLASPDLIRRRERHPTPDCLPADTPEVCDRQVECSPICSRPSVTCNNVKADRKTLLDLLNTRAIVGRRMLGCRLQKLSLMRILWFSSLRLIKCTWEVYSILNEPSQPDSPIM